VQKSVLSRLVLLATALLIAAGLQAQRKKPAKDDPAAHALYDKMVATLRRAGSLSFESDYAWYGKGGKEIGHCTYSAFLKKPNQFRLDTVRADGKRGGVLIGDGRNAWIHWPNGRPFFSTEDPKNRSKPRDRDYYQVRTPRGGHSIGHMTGLLGAGMSMTVLDLSTFHGYTDSMQPYLDGVTPRGAASTADGEECDIIRVSLMKGQRIWELWLSKKDHLPRRLTQTVRVSYEIVTTERWRSVRFEPELKPDLFAWTPPEGYKRWFRPDPKDRLLETGTAAPDFHLRLAGGKRLRLSDLQGKVVWLIFWRVG
jgi:outer membrane lipoprotein-sorting protein